MKILLNLDGVKILTKNSQKTLNGGIDQVTEMIA